MDKLSVGKAFALGNSQGGWVVTRMALLAPERILCLILLGTSMDYKSSDSRSNGAWDPKTLLTSFYEKWCSPTPTPDFMVDDIWCGMVGSLGFGGWRHGRDGPVLDRHAKGRRKLKMALVCLLDRGGLARRVWDVSLPGVLASGTQDAPFGITIPAEQIKLFTSAEEAKSTQVEGGAHYLNDTNLKEVGDVSLQMVNKYK